MIRIKKSFVILTLFIVITVIFGFIALNSLEIQGMEALLSGDVPSVKNYENMENIFGKSSLLLVIVKIESIYDEGSMEHIYNFVQGLKELKDVKSVNSIFDSAKVRFLGTNIDYQPYFDKGIPAENAEEIFENNLYVGNLINEDGNTLFITIEIDNDDVMEGINELLEDNLSDLEVYTTGGPVVNESINNSIFLLILVFPPLLFLLIIFLYYLKLKNVFAAVIPPLLSILSVIWTLGIAPIMGIKLNVLTSTSGLFLIIICSSYGLHFVDKYISERENNPREEALKITMKEEKRPIIFSGLTTMIGFLTFIFSSMDAFKQLGILVSIGIFFSLLFTIILVPNFIRLKDLRRKGNSLSFNKFFNATGKKFDKTLTIIFLVVLAISPFVISRIPIRMDQYEYFKENDPVTVSSSVAIEEFGWVMPYYVILSNDGKVFTQEDAENISEMIDKLKSIEGINGTDSILDISNSFNIPLPLLQIFSESNNELKAQVSSFLSEGFLRIILKTPETDSINTQRILEGIQDVLKEYEEYKPYVASQLLFTYEMNKEIVQNQISTIVLAFIAIFTLLLILFKSLKVAIVGVVPILMVTAFNFLFMGLFKIPLEIGTAIISGILMGLIIDYSIHLMVYCREDHKSIIQSRKKIGPVILTNSIALSIGFFVMIFAPLRLYTRLSILLTIGMIGGAFITLTVLPYLYEKFIEKKKKN
ncbi:MAG: uncharacterized protein PWQ77_265 [Kosmotogales bacterium]|nr:uncharacterized protein [Kosmotogales bacterium]